MCGLSLKRCLLTHGCYCCVSCMEDDFVTAWVHCVIAWHYWGAPGGGKSLLTAYWAGVHLITNKCLFRLISSIFASLQIPWATLLQHYSTSRVANGHSHLKRRIFYRAFITIWSSPEPTSRFPSTEARNPRYLCLLCCQPRAKTTLKISPGDVGDVAEQLETYHSGS